MKLLLISPRATPVRSNTLSVAEELINSEEGRKQDYNKASSCLCRTEEQQTNLMMMKSSQRFKE
jgi:hypothetical protein